MTMLLILGKSEKELRNNCVSNWEGKDGTAAQDKWLPKKNWTREWEEEECRKWR